MSTFGVMLDFNDMMPLVGLAQQHPSTTPGGPVETGTTTTSRTTNKAEGALSKKQLHLLGVEGDQKDSEQPRVPSFSPADPVDVPRPQTQPIPVETPMVPMVPLNNAPQSTASTSTGCQDDQESSKEPAKEEMEVAEEDSSDQENNSNEEEDPPKEEDSNHIYESIQDLNLDLEALVGRNLGPGSLLEPASALPHPQDVSSLGLKSPIYANVSSPKKTFIPHSTHSGSAPLSPLAPDSASTTPGHTSSSSVSSSGIISPASPVSPQDGWQVHTDQDSGNMFYYHPVTRQTTWSDPRSPPPPSSRDKDPHRGREEGRLPSADPSQGLCAWEQLVDDISGRFYYYNPMSGATSWAAPDQLPPTSPSGSTATGRPADGPPPLPEEDYPVDRNGDRDVFTTNSRQLVIPRAQLDLKDGGNSLGRLEELPQSPQRLMENGVPEEGKTLQVRTWRHSVAEDMCVSRRNICDINEVPGGRPSPDCPRVHLLEKAGIINKTKVADNGKKIR